MAYIYKITNTINGKSYIGKTYLPIEERFKQHIQDFKKTRCKNRPLYSAISKYGVENFKIEVIEETNTPAEREMYWIKFYNTYGKTGYNATRGGDGKQYLDINKIIKDYLKLKNTVVVANENNCSTKSVRDILHQYNIEVVSSQEIMKQKHQKQVFMVDKETNQILNEFTTYIEAGRYLIDNGLSNMATPNAAGNKISMVCRGKRQTFAGFKWKMCNEMAD